VPIGSAWGRAVWGLAGPSATARATPVIQGRRLAIATPMCSGPSRTLSATESGFVRLCSGGAATVLQASTLGRGTQRSSVLPNGERLIRDSCRRRACSFWPVGADPAPARPCAVHALRFMSVQESTLLVTRTGSILVRAPSPRGGACRLTMRSVAYITRRAYAPVWTNPQDRKRRLWSISDTAENRGPCPQAAGLSDLSDAGHEFVQVVMSAPQGTYLTATPSVTLSGTPWRREP
jgi:hypothetical protein